MTVWRMRVACWIPKATNTKSEYVTLIFTRYLHESDLMLTLYVHFLSCYAAADRVCTYIEKLLSNTSEVLCFAHSSRVEKNLTFDLVQKSVILTWMPLWSEWCDVSSLTCLLHNGGSREIDGAWKQRVNVRVKRRILTCKRMSAGGCSIKTHLLSEWDLLQN